MDTTKIDALGEIGTIHKDYTQNSNCANCKQDHTADSNECEIWKKEKEISKPKETQNLLPRCQKKNAETIIYAKASKMHTPNPPKHKCQRCKSRRNPKFGKRIEGYCQVTKKHHKW